MSFPSQMTAIVIRAPGGPEMLVPEQRPVDVEWTGPRSLQVTIPRVLDWHLELGSTLTTRALSAMGGAMPRWLWRNPATLAMTGRMASAVLSTGKLHLQGRAPNGHVFQAHPHQTWLITASRACIDGQDAGTPAPLASQTHLGEVWLPQRGLFFAGEAYFKPHGDYPHSRDDDHSRTTGHDEPGGIRSTVRVGEQLGQVGSR